MGTGLQPQTQQQINMDEGREKEAVNLRVGNQHSGGGGVGLRVETKQQWWIVFTPLSVPCFILLSLLLFLPLALMSSPPSPSLLTLRLLFAPLPATCLHWSNRIITCFSLISMLLMLFYSTPLSVFFSRFSALMFLHPDLFILSCPYVSQLSSHRPLFSPLFFTELFVFSLFLCSFFYSTPLSSWTVFPFCFLLNLFPIVICPF